MGESYLDDVHRDIVEFAERHFPGEENEEKRTEFIDSFLEHHGYERQSVWAPPKKKPETTPKRKPSYFGTK